MTIEGPESSVNIPQASARPWAFTEAPRLVNIRLEAHTRAREPNVLGSLSMRPRHPPPRPGSGLKARPPAAEAGASGPLHAPDLVVVERWLEWNGFEDELREWREARSASSVAKDR